MDEIRQVDGIEVISWDGVGGALYDLAVRIDAGVTRSTYELLGPAINAVYAQALAAVLSDRTLGGLVVDVHEGVGDEALGLDVEINRDPYTAASAAFGIHLTCPYWHPTGAPSQREAVLQALRAALEASTPGIELAMRERVLQAFHGHLTTSLGFPVFRNVDRPQRFADGDRVILCDGDQIVRHDTMGETWYITRPSIEIFVAGTDTAALDARIQQVRAAIRSADRLGGLAFEVEEETTDPEVLREAYTASGLGVEIGTILTFITEAGDPYRQGAP